MTPRRSSAAVLAALLTLSLAACTRSSSGGDADADLDTKVSATDLKCGLSNGEKATGEPIKVGGISTMSNGVDFSSSPLAAQAYFDCVNENGGINGRPVEYNSQDDALDPEFCAELLGGMEQMEEVIRSSGQYGPRVPVPEDANAQTKLLAFIGRDPFWSKP